MNAQTIGSSLSDLGFVGAGLVRPECVLATRSGDLFTSDWRGGVAHRLPDGTQRLYEGQTVDGVSLKPNGIALLSDGAFLLAHLGATEGGVFRLEREGAVRPWLLAVDGIPLPPTNFVVQDFAGRTWVTVSTRQVPRAHGYRRSCIDGFIVLVDGCGARVVADGLGYTNEVAVHPDGKWLYVNETFGRRMSRFPLREDGSLGSKQVVTDFGPGTFPDGLAFDVQGHVWVTSIVSNRLIRIAPDGAATLWLEDVDADHLDEVESAYAGDRMSRCHLDSEGRTLGSLSSIAFGGSDLRTAYLGCLLGDRLATLRMPVAGHPPTHWNYTAAL
jgi:sugar lactone lactonase YvrE